MNNPLLHIDGLPAFDQITPEQVAPAIDALLRDAERALERAGGAAAGAAEAVARAASSIFKQPDPRP